MKDTIKTATITFHAPINYGAVLQAFALQTAIRQKLKIDNTVINYQSDVQKREYSVFRKPESARYFVRDMLTFPYYSALKKRKKQFEEFLNCNINKTPEYITVNEVLDAAKKYDVLICGSDQIWNTDLPDYSDAYYLPGIRNKISYGPSLGKRISKRTINKLGEYVDEYQYISFREKTSVQILKENFQKDSVQVIDPVFLLTSEEWNEIIGSLQDKKGNQERKYIFLYSVSYSDNLLKAVSEFSKKMNLPVITAFGSKSITKGIRAQSYGFKVDYSAGPLDFLRYIKEASIVVSDSFHGTAFSVLFHKDFLTFQNLDNGKVNRDERIASLLEVTEISGNALYYDGKTIIFSEERYYRWNHIDSIINHLREDSLSWLNKSIQTVAGTEKNNIDVPVLYERKEDCCGCGACSNICPVQAIEMIEDEERFCYPRINATKCINCKQCIHVCAFKKEKSEVGKL